MGPVMFECVIPGKVGVKKNQRRLIFRGRFPLSLPSTKYLHWESVALRHVNKSKQGMILCELEARFEFHFKNKQAEVDIDNCLGGPLDLLQKAGVIKNDKQVRRVIAEKFFDSEPMVKVELVQYER